MADYKNNEERETLGSFLLNKRGSEFLKVDKLISNDTGEISYDVRRWYYDDNDEEKPTQKGIRIKSGMMKDVITVIAKSMIDEGLIQADEIAVTDESTQ